VPPTRLSLLTAIVLISPLSLPAHDVPNDVTIHTFLKPDGDRLRLLVRVPMKAISDVTFPEQGKGFLDLEKVVVLLPDAARLWISDNVDLYEEAVRLPKPHIAATRVSLESDQSFSSYPQALAHFNDAALTNATTVVWDQTMLDVLFEYPIQSDTSAFSIRPRFERLGIRVLTTLRFLPPGGAERAFEFTDNPGLVRLDPRWYQAAGRFVQAGFWHILDGTDHLLFLFCLVIPFRRFRALIPIVTGFTIAHSITLIASAYDLGPDALWFPPLIETLIAVSILYMALENIIGAGTVHKRWMTAFGFGLVHGFGFSFALRQTLQFAGSHLLTSLLSFNIGIELGQLLVLALLIPALELLFRFGVAERMGTIILSAFVAHTAWHWTTERWEQLRKFPFQWPEVNAAWLASAMRGLMVTMIIAALVWSVAQFLKRRAALGPPSDSDEIV
jgi:hypothetical protein